MIFLFESCSFGVHIVENPNVNVESKRNIDHHCSDIRISLSFHVEVGVICCFHFFITKSIPEAMLSPFLANCFSPVYFAPLLRLSQRNKHAIIQNPR